MTTTDTTEVRRSAGSWKQQLPQLHVLDLRSLALFRISLGIYILYDIFSRLKLGRLDMAWYTSSSSLDTTSFLDQDDTPHRSPIHRVWFYRGSATFQYAMFALTAVVDLVFLLGINHPVACPLLWCLVVSYQHRNMFVHDGSDNFLRQLLLWSCFLPVNKQWSLQQEWLKRRQQQPQQPTTFNTLSSTSSFATNTTSLVSSLACAGLTLQIVFMYWGTVWHRSLDLYPISQLHQSEWMPPTLTAVHYAMSGSFATRSNHNVLANLIRQTPFLSRIMTIMAMMGEFGAPLACLLLPISYRHYPAILLFLLHLNLLFVLNLPNWQFLGMLATVIWIPPSVWDRSRLCRVVAHDEYKKTDGDDASRSTSPQVSSTRKPRYDFYVSPGKVWLCYFFFTYMIYNWCGERGWIRKHDGGDIGELFRISQYWVMYSTVSHTACATLLMATTTTAIHNTTVTTLTTGHDMEDPPPGTIRQHWDVLHGIRTGRWVPLNEEDYHHLLHKDTIIEDSSDRSVSPRWERALDQWCQRRDTARAQRFCTSLCRLLSSSSTWIHGNNLTSLQLIWKYYDVLPPGSTERYRPRHDNIYLQVSCPKQ